MLRKNKFLITLLSILMAIAMMPAAAFAVEEAPKESTEPYTEWSAASTKPTSGHYKLTNDLTVQCFTVSGNLTIDLNGHTLTKAFISNIMFTVEDGGSLTIEDSSPGKTGQIISSNSTVINVSGSGAFTMTGGTIKGGGTAPAIKTTSPNVTITGGTIENYSTKNYDSAVALRVKVPDSSDNAVQISNAKLTASNKAREALSISSGKVNLSGCEITKKGDLGYIAESSGAVTFTNCTISNDTANPLSTGVMIDGGSADFNGGSIAITSSDYSLSCALKIKNSTVSSDAVISATGSGGSSSAVYISGGTFTMIGGSIKSEQVGIITDSSPQGKSANSINIKGGTISSKGAAIFTTQPIATEINISPSENNAVFVDPDSLLWKTTPFVDTDDVQYKISGGFFAVDPTSVNLIDSSDPSLATLNISGKDYYAVGAGSVKAALTGKFSTDDIPAFDAEKDSLTLTHGSMELTDIPDLTAANSSDNDGTFIVDGQSIPVGESAYVHNLEHVDAKAATCTEDGNIEYWRCRTCGKKYSDAGAQDEIKPSDDVNGINDPLVIKAAGHKWSGPEWTWSDDHQSASAAFTCENESDPSRTETVDAEVTGTVTKEAGAYSKGEKTYTATVNFGGKDYTDQYIEEIPAKGAPAVITIIDDSSDTGKDNPDNNKDNTKDDADSTNTGENDNTNTSPNGSDEVPTVTGTILPTAAVKSGSVQKLTWNAVQNADGYYVYAARAGKSLKKGADVSASGKLTYTAKSLTAGKTYKFRIDAYCIVAGEKTVVKKSPLIRSLAGNTSSKYTNVKSVKASKHSVSLSRGKKYTVKAKLYKYNKKRSFLPNAAKLRYLSSNTRVATVSRKGKVTAKKSGRATIYVIASNGKRDKVKVTVK